MGNRKKINSGKTNQELAFSMDQASIRVRSHLVFFKQYLFVLYFLNSIASSLNTKYSLKDNDWENEDWEDEEEWEDEEDEEDWEDEDDWEEDEEEWEDDLGWNPDEEEWEDEDDWNEENGLDIEEDEWN